MKIRTGDTVRVITGKDKGKEGNVERIYKKQQKIAIPTLNLFKRHMKKSQEMPQGGIVEVPRPLDVSNVMVVCPSCKKPTRIGYSTESGKKMRVCKKCKAVITKK